MSILNSLRARLRSQPDERRAVPRHATHLDKKLYVYVYHYAPNPAAGAPRLVGYTRDVSELGVGVVLQTHRLAGRSIVGPERKLRVLLGLPEAPVEMIAGVVRCAEMEGADGGYIVGVQIQSMGGQDRARYLRFLGALTVPDI